MLGIKNAVLTEEVPQIFYFNFTFNLWIIFYHYRTVSMLQRFVPPKTWKFVNSFVREKFYISWQRVKLNSTLNLDEYSSLHIVHLLVSVITLQRFWKGFCTQLCDKKIKKSLKIIHFTVTVFIIGNAFEIYLEDICKDRIMW